ncbi:MAG: ABC transporter permease [Candidatus Obscuribacterales bacterium]|jgi:ABC-2 type transport system permease protein|nr:ABC transporter permease [Candidatus Obscuribacterales bacterium]
MLRTIIDKMRASHLWALIVKESREILRNKYLLFLILVPPTIQLLILGGALDPQVRNLTLAAVDHAQSKSSRELIAALSKSKVFQKNITLPNEQVLSREIEKGKYDAGIVIPQDFTLDLKQNKLAEVQIIVDGVNAYSAGIASADLLKNINNFRNQSDNQKKLTISNSSIEPDIEILYNPNQSSSWFFVPGILGACLTLTATLVASATVLRERESGTMEQLLMTPAEPWEILLAKIIPLVFFLLGDVCLAVFAAQLIFGMPCRGSFLLLLASSALYSFVGIGLGMLLGSICQSQRQAQLSSFFINIPLILLSGSVVPFDTMPAMMQAVALFDPLRYYILIARGVLLKGATLSMLWLNVSILAIFAFIILFASANRFRKQLV